MNRCFIHMPARRTLSATCAAALALLPLLAGAQVATDQFQRRFPERARRGVLRITHPPDILLDGPDRLSPASRIRTEANLIVPPHQLIGQEPQVNYTREGLGAMVHEVWLLTPVEQAHQRAGKGEVVQQLPLRVETARLTERGVRWPGPVPPHRLQYACRAALPLCFPMTARRVRLTPGASFLRENPAMSKKVFIKTFGCQMNEHDSDKMVDVLGAARGQGAHRRPRAGRPDPVQHLLGAREGAGESLQRPWAASST